MINDKQREYFKNYYNEHKEYWKNRIIRRSGYFLYRYRSLLDDEILYVGKSVDFMGRVVYHENYFGDVLQMIYEDDEEYTIEFMDLFDYLDNDQELLYAEKHLIRLLKPHYNDNRNGNYKISDERKEEINNIVERAEWIELKEVDYEDNE